MIFYFVVYVMLSVGFALSLVGPGLFPALTGAVLGLPFYGVLFLVALQFLLDLDTPAPGNPLRNWQRGLITFSLCLFPIPGVAIFSVLLLSFSALIGLGLWQWAHLRTEKVSIGLLASIVVACVSVLLGAMSPEAEVLMPSTLLICLAVTFALVRNYWIGRQRSGPLMATLFLFTLAQVFSVGVPAPLVAFLSIPFVALLLTDVWLGCGRAMKGMDLNKGRWSWIATLPILTIAFAGFAVVPGAHVTLPTLIPNLSLVVFLILPLGIVMFETLLWEERGFASATFTIGALSLCAILFKFSGSGFSFQNMHSYEFFADVIPYVVATFSWVGASVLCRVWYPFVGFLPDK